MRLADEERRRGETDRLHPTAHRLPIGNNWQENIEAFSLSIGPAAVSDEARQTDGCRNRVIGFKQAKDWLLQFGGCRYRHQHLGLSTGHNYARVTMYYEFHGPCKLLINVRYRINARLLQKQSLFCILIRIHKKHYCYVIALPERLVLTQIIPCFL